MTFNSFDQAVILDIETVENKPSELGVTEGLSNGCKSIGSDLDLVEVGMRGEVVLLHLAKLVTKLHSPRGGCERKLVLRVVQASNAMVAKRTSPETDGMRDPTIAERMAWTCITQARCFGLGTSAMRPPSV
jgi:hypothetical protein